MPAVTAAVLTDSATITFTGNNFLMTGYDAKASFNSLWADEVTVIDATSAIAKWNKGVPVVSSETVPQLKFVKTSGRRILAEGQSDSPLAHFASNSATLTNPLSITQSSSELECSFAGGCAYEITAKGLSTLLKDNQNNYVTVCD